MAITINSPRFSFVQFGESGAVQSCNFPNINLCLPVYEPSDVAFQFIAVAGTAEEATELCSIENDRVRVGIVEACSDGFLIEFEQKPERYRISDRQILYNWQHGLPDYDTEIEIGECFMIKIVVELDGGTYEFCSNCFQRIAETCHTSVVEYGSSDNGFGFNYCFSEAIDEDQAECEPTIISFTNIPSLVIPYTASLAAKYGNLPTVQVWIYDTNGELVDMGIRVAFDTYPPTELRFDFGGNGSGIIKIM